MGDWHITDDEAVALAGLSLLVFSILLVLSLFRLTIRLLEYHFRLRRRPPTIAKRDWVFEVLLAVPFVAFLIARAFEITDLRNFLPWIVLTTLPALIAMGVLVWYEFFVIETPYVEDGTCPCTCHTR